MENLPRDVDGRISAYYYCTPEEIAEFGFEPPPPPPLRRREDGWTPEKQLRFIETLAATGTVAGACATVGMSRMSAYRLRNRADAGAFRRAWDEAMRCALGVLADAAFQRALEGVREPVYHKGEKVDERVRYNDRLLMFMLRARDPLNYAPVDELGRWQAARGGIPADRGISGALEALKASEEEWESRPDDAPPARIEAAPPAPALPGPALPDRDPTPDPSFVSP